MTRLATIFTFALCSAVIGLTGCGSVAYSQRLELLPPKPQGCPIEQLGDIKSPPGYELVGTVSLVRRKYQAELTIDQKALELLDTEACKLGGDAVSFAASTTSSADFLVFRKLAPPPRRTQPAPGWM